MATEGGMITPSSPEEAVVAALKGRGYFCFSISGISIDPTAAAVAAEEPEIVAKSIEVSTTAAARPPRTQLSSAFATSTSRSAMPPCCISLPAST
jgi:hypothetical protein